MCMEQFHISFSLKQMMNKTSERKIRLHIKHSQMILLLIITYYDLINIILPWCTLFQFCVLQYYKVQMEGAAFILTSVSTAFSSLCSVWWLFIFSPLPFPLCLTLKWIHSFAFFKGNRRITGDVFTFQNVDQILLILCKYYNFCEKSPYSCITCLPLFPSTALQLSHSVD